MKTNFRFFLVTLLALISFENLMSQNNSRIALPVRSICSTPAKSNPQNLLNLNNNSANSFVDNSYVSVCVRIYFHVIRKTDGTGGQTATAVNQAFNVLINDFYPRDITFSWDGSIDYINNTTFYNNPNSGQTSTVPPTIFSVNKHLNGIDVYLFADTAPAGGLANGVGTAAGFYVGGSYWNPPYGSLITSHVISHEMGHVLGLWHTHHGTINEGDPSLPDYDSAQCPELVNGSNSTTCGDYVSDTRADPFVGFNVNTSCSWLGSGIDSNGQNYNPMTNNIMAYTSPSCMSLFTVKQGKRMKKALINLPFLQACSRYSYGIVDNTVPPHPCTFPLPRVAIFPNPTDNFLNFEYDKENFDVDYKMFNSSLENVLEGKLNKQNSKMSTEKLPNGNYYLHLYVDGELIIKTIIINHKN